MYVLLNEVDELERKSKQRIILHVDMNSFYASVEMAKDHSLQGKPLAIAGDAKQRKGIIVTCNYEARALGIHTRMPVWEAKRLCPHLIVKQPNFPLYKRTSFLLFQFLSQYTNIIQPVSIDEGYLDMTNDMNLENPLGTANDIQKEILKQLSLPCSIGIAPNKFLAKMASNMKKPLGITILRKRDVPKILWPLNVTCMHGVGEKTAVRLNKMGIVTIGDLAQGDEKVLRKELGINGALLKQRANGVDDRPVDPEQINQFKSIGNSRTLPTNTDEEHIVFPWLENIAGMVSNRLQKKNMVTYSIQLTMTYSNRVVVTRSMQLQGPTDCKQDIYRVACLLWKNHWNGSSVRLLGITANNVVELKSSGKQLDLFSYEEDVQQEPLQQVLEELRKKYGESIVQKGKEKNSSFQDRLRKKFT